MTITDQYFPLRPDSITKLLQHPTLKMICFSNAEISPAMLAAMVDALALGSAVCEPRLEFGDTTAFSFLACAAAILRHTTQKIRRLSLEAGWGEETSDGGFFAFLHHTTKTMCRLVFDHFWGGNKGVRLKQDALKDCPPLSCNFDVSIVPRGHENKGHLFCRILDAIAGPKKLSIGGKGLWEGKPLPTKQYYRALPTLNSEDDLL